MCMARRSVRSFHNQKVLNLLFELKISKIGQLNLPLDIKTKLFFVALKLFKIGPRLILSLKSC